MRSPSILTVVVKVDPDKIVELEGYLRDRVNPTPDGATKAFGFENYPNLHFISFSMPPEEGELPAQLVMEATFDGPEDAFIRDLVALDLRALAGIFGHCCRFPKMVRRNPHLVEIFLQTACCACAYFLFGRARQNRRADQARAVAAGHP
ncbi:hypothetical protein OAV60_00475 [Paracoccaceae bacterium]|nr:hypothetical protein [Paracoccaceae bacterium]